MYNIYGIAEKVKELRKKNGLTQEQAADGLNMNIKTYRAIENGNRMGRIDTLCLLAEYYEVSLDYLLGAEIDTPKSIDKCISMLPPMERNLVLKLINTIFDCINHTK